MRSSNGLIYKREDVEKLAIAHQPNEIHKAMSVAAKEISDVNLEDRVSSFRMSELVAEYTGIAKVEKENIIAQIEMRALERLKEIEETARGEAYKLGLEEGRAQAFTDHKAEIHERVQKIDTVLNEIQELKKDLVQQNEAHLIKLLYYMASRIAMIEIAEKPDVIVPVLTEAIASAQRDEKVYVRIAKRDYEFLQQNKEVLVREIDTTKRVELQEDETIEPGGCIVETNYGVIDATVQERVDKLWTVLTESLPKQKAEGPNGSGDDGQPKT